MKFLTSLLIFLSVSGFVWFEVTIVIIYLVFVRFNCYYVISVKFLLNFLVQLCLEGLSLQLRLFCNAGFWFIRGETTWVCPVWIGLFGEVGWAWWLLCQRYSSKDENSGLYILAHIALFEPHLQIFWVSCIYTQILHVWNRKFCEDFVGCWRWWYGWLGTRKCWWT